jgi:hypothetical protein
LLHLCIKTAEGYAANSAASPSATNFVTPFGSSSIVNSAAGVRRTAKMVAAGEAKRNLWRADVIDGGQKGTDSNGK